MAKESQEKMFNQKKTQIIQAINQELQRLDNTKSKIGITGADIGNGICCYCCTLASCLLACVAVCIGSGNGPGDCPTCDKPLGGKKACLEQSGERKTVDETIVELERVKKEIQATDGSDIGYLIAKARGSLQQNNLDPITLNNILTAAELTNQSPGLDAAASSSNNVAALFQAAQEGKVPDGGEKQPLLQEQPTQQQNCYGGL